jgi:hypothetical protein
MGGSPATRFSPCISLRRKVHSHAIAKLRDDERQIPDLEAFSDADTDTDESTELRRSAKHVVFANVEVREYAVTVGDHPCCTMGCPLTLDWDYSVARSTSVEDYESQRGPRRSRDELKTTAPERMRLLSEDAGLSDGELRRATRKLFRARSSSARLSEKMSESFFRYDQTEQQLPESHTASGNAMEHASPCA